MPRRRTHGSGRPGDRVVGPDHHSTSTTPMISFLQFDAVVLVAGACPQHSGRPSPCGCGHTGPRDAATPALPRSHRLQPPPSRAPCHRRAGNALPRRSASDGQRSRKLANPSGRSEIAMARDDPLILHPNRRRYAGLLVSARRTSCHDGWQSVRCADRSPSAPQPPPVLPHRVSGRVYSVARRSPSRSRATRRRGSNATRATLASSRTWATERPETHHRVATRSHAGSSMRSGRLSRGRFRFSRTSAPTTRHPVTHSRTSITTLSLCGCSAGVERRAAQRDVTRKRRRKHSRYPASRIPPENARTSRSPSDIS
jgi:hypothetical protein